MEARDLAVLEMAAVNAVVLPEHIERLLALDAEAAGSVIDGLVADGLLSRLRVGIDRPAVYLITRFGLDAVGSVLPEPVFDAGLVRRDVGATWLWLAVRDGAFGPMERVISRRELAALGEPADADVIVVTATGWAPIHLVYALPSRLWLERLMRGYGNDPRVAGWLFLAEDLEPARDLVNSVASDLGLSEMNRVQGLVR
jgi:hypothetical protein